MSGTGPSMGGSPPLMIDEQGSFAVGGTVIGPSGRLDAVRRDPQVRTMHGDHAYVSYQIPSGPRRHPLVMLHGNGQFSKTWETTPDGREGFNTIFLRRGFGVYLVDQPRRGRAGRSTASTVITPELNDQFWFNMFRVGIWPDFFPGVQFADDPAALDQYFRQMTPDTGPFDLDVMAGAMTALFDRIGPGILVTHSRGGGVGWFTAARTANVRAIVSYEPGTNFPFPHGEAPPAMPSASGTLEPASVDPELFQRLTTIPILIVYGDYIPREPVDNAGQDAWRVRLAMARLWADAVNRRGGDVSVVHLPEIGIRGNTHFPFSDLNNTEIADHMTGFLERKRLDRAVRGTAAS